MKQLKGLLSCSQKAIGHQSTFKFLILKVNTADLGVESEPKDSNQRNIRNEENPL
jgi:hypothetical protein